MLYSQIFQTKDSLKTLVESNFISMEVSERKNGKMVPTRIYSYNKESNEITIKNISTENNEWVKTIFKLDDNDNIKEEERITEGLVISEKGNYFEKKQLSMIKKYIYSRNTMQILFFDTKGELSEKEFYLYDDKNQVIEKIILLKSSNDIVVAEIERYNWVDLNSYKYEKFTFNVPKSEVVGVYQLNKYGDRVSLKGKFIFNEETELIDVQFNNVNKKFDSKRNLINVFKIENNSQTLIEERKIIY